MGHKDKDGTQAPPTGLIGVAAVLLTLAATLMWVSMLTGPWRLVSGLVDAGRHLERSEKSLSVTALKRARYEVFAGSAAAARARAGFDALSPLADVARLIPTAREALDEVDHLVAASDFSAEAALGTLRIAKNALHGPTRIIAADPANPEDSVIRLDRIEEIAGSIAKIRVNLEGVQTELRAVELASLPRRVRSSVTDGLAKAVEAETVIADAQAGFEVLPAVLGADEPRTYLIGMQNPAEQRGTGGAILRFSLFTFDEGKSDFDKCDPAESACGRSVYDIDRDRRLYDIDLPKEAWYVDGIEDAHRFGNSNWSPDWPSSAQLMLEYGEAADERLVGDVLPEVDGFMTLDPIVMEDLIPGTGPFKLDDFGNKITANKAVHFLLYKAYASYPRKGLRRAALRRVVDQFIDKLLDPDHPTELVTGMGESLGSKHMMIWMKDPDEQAFIERMDWDGGIEDQDDADFVYLVEQNVGGNKFDYYAEHATSMDITLEGTDADVSTETTISNGTFFPQPSWAMGDSGRPDPDGNPQVPMHEPMMNLYVPRDAELSEAKVDGSRVDTPEPAEWTNGMPPTHEEQGKKVWSATLQIPPGEDGSVRFDYRVPGVVTEENGRSSYRLVVQHQPRVRPETMEINLTLPEGASAIVAPEWERVGENLVWSQPLRRDMVLKVSWA